jgi:hypothetical protein
MCHEVRTTVVHVPLGKLHESPKNRLLHADIDFQGRDSLLLADIERHGILLPFVILPNMEIKDGHRRFAVAKKLGLATVPCLIAEAGDGDAMFTSAQLARHLTLFAKCLLHRERIEALCARGEAVNHANLKFQQTDARSDAEAVAQSWIQLEEALGASRRYLSGGVKLLATLETMSKHHDAEERGRAGRVIQTFRNRGLKPAMRLLGESVEAYTGGDEPDVAEYTSSDDEPAAAAAKSTAKPASKKRGVNPNVIPLAGNWQRIASRYVNDLRGLLQDNNRLTPGANEALSALTRVITRKVESHAA